MGLKVTRAQEMTDDLEFLKLVDWAIAANLGEGNYPIYPFHDALVSSKCRISSVPISLESYSFMCNVEYISGLSPAAFAIAAGTIYLLVIPEARSPFNIQH
jgi:hypothetical protein